MSRRGPAISTSRSIASRRCSSRSRSPAQRASPRCLRGGFGALMVLPNTRHQIAIITVKNRPLSPTAQLSVNGVRAITKPLA